VLGFELRQLGAGGLPLLSGRGFVIGHRDASCVSKYP
jgi:hypothetical protein